MESKENTLHDAEKLAYTLEDYHSDNPPPKTSCDNTILDNEEEEDVGWTWEDPTAGPKIAVTIKIATGQFSQRVSHCGRSKESIVDVISARALHGSHKTKLDCKVFWAWLDDRAFRERFGLKPVELEEHIITPTMRATYCWYLQGSPEF